MAIDREKKKQNKNGFGERIDGNLRPFGRQYGKNQRYRESFFRKLFRYQIQNDAAERNPAYMRLSAKNGEIIHTRKGKSG